MHRAGLGYLTRYFNSVQDLKVQLGDDVELECTTSASEAPEYFWAKEVTDLLSNGFFFSQQFFNMMHYSIFGTAVALFHVTDMLGS